MLPKPARRIVDPELLRRYALEHPKCVLDNGTGHDCVYLLRWEDGTKRPHVHHMKFRGRGGDDVEANVISLCDAHHNGYAGVQGWHSYANPWDWFKEYGPRLSDVDYAKIGKFLEILIGQSMKKAPPGKLAEYRASLDKFRRNKRCPWCGGPLAKGKDFCTPACERQASFHEKQLERMA